MLDRLRFGREATGGAIVGVGENRLGLGQRVVGPRLDFFGQEVVRSAFDALGVR